MVFDVIDTAPTPLDRRFPYANAAPCTTDRRLRNVTLLAYCLSGVGFMLTPRRHGASGVESRERHSVGIGAALRYANAASYSTERRLRNATPLRIGPVSIRRICTPLEFVSRVSRECNAAPGVSERCSFYANTALPLAEWGRAYATPFRPPRTGVSATQMLTLASKVCTAASAHRFSARASGFAG